MIAVRWVLVVSVISGVSLASFPEIPNSYARFSEVEEGLYRLPDDTIPISYDVTLEPDFETFEFLGEVMITTLVQRETSTITLHADDIIRHSVRVKLQNEADDLIVTNIREEVEYDFLRIDMQNPLQPGAILEVIITYTGFLGMDNAGFYRASYEEDGETKWFGTTQFESTAARRAFPCYDEPALKATFIIHMIRSEAYNTISNMDLIDTTPLESGKYMDTFSETVIMPTYLVAFIVSEMDSTERREGQAVYATPAHIADGRGEYGLQIGIDVLKAMADFTGFPYPLPKMDQVGIPDNWFAAGAMENWGLVTYRERYVLYKEGLSTSSEKQSVVSIIAHEFGHQWFGNLVSPLWWDYIWLNEGFATYFEHYATDQVEPDMQMMDQFVTLCNQYAMESDSLPSARAMVHHAETPTEIDNLFDRIAYEKSGSVIRMMEHFLTTEIFEHGLNIYLTEMQYSAAQPSDLWNGLQAAVDQKNPDILGEQTVEDIMETWNRQAGFPVIDVSRNGDGKIVLEQSRFFRDTATDSTESKWTVPINYATTSDPNFENTEATLWLTEVSQTTEIEIAEDQGIILNKQSTGYYRVNYGELWRQVIDYMNTNTNNYNSIHKLSRSQLYDDAFSLARSGRISYNITMDLVSCLKRETEYVPLYSFFRGLTFLHPYLINSGERYDYFKEFMRETLQAAFEEVTKEELDHTSRLNRINVMTWLCRFDHEECIDSLHEKLVNLDTGADPDMQTLVYCSGLIKDEESESKWMFLYERYNGNEAESLEKTRILNALGCTGSVTQLTRWLDTIFGIDEELQIANSARSTAFSAIVGAHRFGLDTAFNYILENFEKITTSNYVGSALGTLANRLSTAEQLEQIEGLFESLTDQLQTQFNSNFQSARNTIQNNINNSNRYIGDIKLWLDEYMSSGVEEGYRLPNDTIPISYDVILEPDFESFEFLGEVTITIQVQRVTNTITMHANDIIIDSITVKDPNEVENLRVSQTKNETEYHLLMIRVQDDLQPGQILEVNIKYTGFLRTNNAGFYRASYEEDGETKWFGTTQFESTSARRAFPCYDEPALKARFTIHMIRGETYNTISNMELISSTLVENGKYMDTFNETVIMPTYLVAFVVSEMDSTERHEGQAVYATPAHIADGRGEYGLDMGIEVLKAITVFTEISYPLPKMDQIGIPDGWFAAGAMENWGLVTYRERYILYKEGLSTSSEKQSVVSIIAHEFGHQWFGNLVSPLWWDYIWLNEGFATYFEHYATEQVEPGMQMMDQFVTLCNQYAMESDSLPNARAMVHHAETPQQISSLFDRIAYEKSGAVIRMMEHFLTTEIFQRGLNIYLTEMQYGAAQPSDLWNGLQAAVDEIDLDILGDHTVEDIMETWNSQAGFPVIDVSRNNDGNIVLRQSRFFRDTATDSTNSKWTVPINYATTSDPNFEDTEPTLWLTEATQTTDIEIAEEEGIILNKQSTGYYRVNYGDLWRQIIDYMSTDNYNNIHKLSRSQLYDDAFNLARSGRISYNITMDLVGCLQRETEYVPLYSLFRGLTFLYPYLVNSGERYDYFKEFMRGTLQAAYEKVTEEELEHPARLNRINVLTWLCRFDHEECINSLHQELVELDTGADPDMQTLVYCSGLIKDEESEPKWMFLYERYNGNEAESLEKARILSALGCTGSVTQLNRWLDTIFGIDEELEIDSASRSTAFSAIIGGHKFGLDTTFKYILENFEKISTSSYAGTALQTLAARLTTVEQWEQFDGLFDSLTNQLQTQFNSSFVTARNTIQNNIDNSDRYIGDIKLWLDEYMSGGVEEGYRLPNDTIPISYDVILEPDFESFEFLGEVTITIQVQRVTNTITLHANDIIIDSITVKEPNEVENLSVSQTRNETQYHLLLIRMQKDLQPEQILEVNIKYTGFLRDNNAGFYRASYEENGETKWFGTTQFESTSARRAFPCYDEPALKARFTIHMIRGETYNSISNMELISSTLLENGKYMDTFNETVIMPTYLVAFVVSEMNSTERNEGQAVYATPAHIADGRGEYGLEMGIEVLKAITVFTEISYPLPKMDQIGIPDDWFAAGAMENWGLVTYRERYILYKEGLSTSSEKQSVVSIIAHEFGHQWFGNLVSPLWWDYIWLNEGFATYFEHYATEQVEPGMQMMDQFVTLCNQYAMESDSLPNARAMVHHAETPQQISSLFDRIAYEKSGAVIRMMEHFLTTQIFQRGLNIYLTEMQYSAAQPSDLWNGLQAAVNEEDTDILGDLTVEDIMETWNSQAGFPVIDVARNNDGNIVLKQSRFFRDTATDSTNSKWTVPINYATTSDPNFGDTGLTLWLTEATQTTDIEIAEDEGIILNKQSTGYYRVNYGDLWRQITDYMSTDNYNNIHKLSRSQLYDDAFNLARSGRISYNITMDLVSCLQRETEYVPLYSFFRGLTFLYPYLVNSGERYDYFKEFMRETLQAAYEKVTEEELEHPARLNRINVLTWLCRFDHEECINSLHEELVELETGADPDMQTLVYCSGLIKDEGSESKWMFLYERYNGNEAESLEKARILSALGCTGSVTQLNRWLDTIFGIDEQLEIDSASRSTAFSAIIGGHKFGLDTTFNYILENFEEMSTSSYAGTALQTLAARLTTAEQLEQFDGLFDSLTNQLQTQFNSSFVTARNTIQNNIDNSDKYIGDVKLWLDEHSNAFVFGISLPLLLAMLLAHLLT